MSLRVAFGMILALAVGCTSDPSSEGRTSATASPSAAVLPFEGDGAQLVPGRYAYDEFSGPPMSFAVGSGWIGGHVLPEFFDVQREEGGVLLGFADPTFVMADDGAVDVADLTAEDAIGSIASNRAFRARPVRSTTIGDRAAFEVAASPRASVELFGGNEGSFTVEPGSVRLLAVDVGGSLMLIVVSVFEDQPDRVEEAIDGVIASVMFE